MANNWTRGYILWSIHLLLTLVFLLQLQQCNSTTSLTASPANLKTGDPNVLIFTTYHDIRLANLSNVSRSSAVHIDILAKDLSEGAGLDFYYEKQLICWTDQGREAIQCMKMNSSWFQMQPNGGLFDEEDVSDKKYSVISKGIDKPEGLAIDWLTEKIYFTDGETNRIEVATLPLGKFQKVLFWTELDQPRAIILVPDQKLMIWSDWGENPKIERASMCGDPGSRVVLVNERIFWPNGLTVDLENSLIYWVDGNLQFLDVMNMDGSNRRSIVKDLQYPYSVTYINKKLYWSDWQQGSINSYDIETSEIKKVIGTPEVPITVHAFHKSLQPAGNNPCKTNNGNCSHLCLLSTNSGGFSCACPTGIKLLTSTQCAEGPQNVIFLVQRTQISKISLDSPDYTSFPLSLGKVKYAIAIDYDPVEDFIYWSDEESHAIKRARQDGTAVTDIITTEIDHPDGLAIDYIARNLYWTDTGTDRIEVCRLNGSFRKVLINENLEEPRAIAVAPTLGWFFWSDWNEKKPKIERASLDGTERVIIVSDDLGWPNGIALDVLEKMIYWCDAKTDKIERSNMDGSDRRVILNDNLPHVFGLSLLGEFLYWTDWQRRTVERAHKVTAERTVIIDQYPDLMGLKVTMLHEAFGTNPCANKNGGCTHLCLNRPADYVCRCQIDYELAKDKKTCVAPAAFLLYSRDENIGRISIDYNEENHNDNIPFKEVKDAKYLDVDIADRRVYWSDQKSKAISRAFLNGSDVHRVVESGLQMLEGVAVDWIGHNIFWADGDAHRIEVARLDGSSRRILLWKGINKPRILILEPRKGLLYFSESTDTIRADTIRRAAMDGSDLTTIIANVNGVVGLTIDNENRRLYWASQSPTAIESADLDGKRRSKLFSGDAESHYSPHAITIYQDFIFWSDWNTGDVQRVHKSGQNRTLIHTSLSNVNSLLVFHTSRQSGTNQCKSNNGGCTHLCLALPGNRKMTCACPTHYTLDKDGLSCSAPKNYLIFSQRNSFGRLLPNSTDSPDAPLPVTAKNIKNVEYDPVDHVVYWIDGRSTIRRSSVDNATKVGPFINPGSQPFDLAIDYIGRLLFWTCSHANVINITSLDGYPLGVVDTGDSEKPRSIAVHAVKRLLFWTDAGSQQAVIRARMDGSDAVVLANKLEGIMALAVDPVANLLFFAHGKRIESIDIHGENRRTLISTNVNEVSSIAPFQYFIYWLDDKTGLEKASMHGEVVPLQRNEKRIAHISDIVAVWQPDSRTIKSHPCLSPKAKCSHICIASVDSNKEDEVCSCPKDLNLLKDKRNCADLPVCGPDHFTCAMPDARSFGDNKGECIPVSWRCDGQIDCPDKSDEMDCPSCRSDQFRCQSGECIEKTFVCDGTTHCQSADDEADCCKNAQDFQCPGNRVCIAASLVCDGWENCFDGADESIELCSQSNNRRTAPTSDKKVFVIVLVVIVIIIFFIVYVLQMYRTKFADSIREPKEDQAMAPLSPGSLNKGLRVTKITSVADAVRLSTLNSRTSNNSYDRNHITGASSSTTNNSSLVNYPNPPPSPATTTGSNMHNSYPYKHYKKILPPPPTPCSTTDACDESDSNYTPVSYKTKNGSSVEGDSCYGGISGAVSNSNSIVYSNGSNNKSF